MNRYMGIDGCANRQKPGLTDSALNFGNSSPRKFAYTSPDRFSTGYGETANPKYVRAHLPQKVTRRSSRSKWSEYLKAYIGWYLNDEKKFKVRCFIEHHVEFQKQNHVDLLKSTWPTVSMRVSSKPRVVIAYRHAQGCISETYNGSVALRPADLFKANSNLKRKHLLSEAASVYPAARPH